MKKKEEIADDSTDKAEEIPALQQKEVKVETPNSKVVGNPDSFQLLWENYDQAVKAYETSEGCLVEVTRYGRTALCFVPNARIVPDINGGKKLI